MCHNVKLHSSGQRISKQVLTLFYTGFPLVSCVFLIALTCKELHFLLCWIIFVSHCMQESFVYSLVYANSWSNFSATNLFMRPHRYCLVSFACFYTVLKTSIPAISLQFTWSFLPQEGPWKTCWLWQEVSLLHHFPASSPMSWLWMDFCPPLSIGCTYSCSRYMAWIQSS